MKWDYVVYEKPLSQKVEVEKLQVENAPLLNTDIKLNTDIIKKEEFDFEELEELNVDVWKKWRAYRKETFRLTYKPIGEKAAIEKSIILSSG